MKKKVKGVRGGAKKKKAGGKSAPFVGVVFEWPWRGGEGELGQQAGCGWGDLQRGVKSKVRKKKNCRSLKTESKGRAERGDLAVSSVGTRGGAKQLLRVSSLCSRRPENRAGRKDQQGWDSLGQGGKGGGASKVKACVVYFGRSQIGAPVTTGHCGRERSDSGS